MWASIRETNACVCVCGAYMVVFFFFSLPWSLWCCEKLVQEMRQKSALTPSHWSNWSEIYEKLVCEAVSHRGQWVQRLDDQIKVPPESGKLPEGPDWHFDFVKRYNLSVSKNNGMPQQELSWQPVKEAPARGSIAVMSIFTRRSSVNTKPTEKSGR